MSLAVVTRLVRNSCQLCTDSAARMEAATSGTCSRHLRRAAITPAQMPNPRYSSAQHHPAHPLKYLPKTRRVDGGHTPSCGLSPPAARARTVHWCHGCCPQQVLLSHSVLGLQHPQEVLGEAQAMVWWCLGCFNLQDLHGAAI